MKHKLFKFIHKLFMYVFQKLNFKFYAHLQKETLFGNKNSTTPFMYNEDVRII